MGQEQFLENVWDASTIVPFPTEVKSGPTAVKRNQLPNFVQWRSTMTAWNLQPKFTTVPRVNSELLRRQ